MRITKSKLRRIIKEEAVKLAEASHQGQEAELLVDVDSIATSIEEIAAGMYGMSGPNGPQDGDELARDLEMQVERLNDFFRRLQGHFESADEAAGPAPGGM